MKNMKIYKVRAWVNAKRDKRGNLPEHAFKKEIVIINNLKTAKAIYQDIKLELRMYEQYSNKYPSGHCQLFEPHIFENGTLAHWPDDEKYIEKYKF